MKKIFISSSYKDLNDIISSQLKEELSFIGYEVINPNRDELAHLSEVKESLEFLINQSDLFIAIIKGNNTWQYFELGYALGVSKQILIVGDYEVELPSYLNNYRFLRTDLESSNFIFTILDYLKKINFEEQKKTKPIRSLEEFNILLENDKQVIDKISSSDFEALVAKFFQSRGYNVSQPKRDLEYGFDFIIHNYDGHNKTIVETKKYNPNSKVSTTTIHQAFGIMNIYEADYIIIITTSDFTASARDFASTFSNKVELWNYETLKEKVRITHNNA